MEPQGMKGNLEFKESERLKGIGGVDHGDDDDVCVLTRSPSVCHCGKKF